MRQAEDLTGSEFEFRVYQPKYSFGITATHGQTGHQVQRTLSLTDEQSVEFHGLETQQEKMEFVKRLQFHLTEDQTEVFLGMQSEMLRGDAEGIQAANDP